MSESQPQVTADDLKEQLHEQTKREWNEKIKAIIAGTAIKEVIDE